MKAWHFVNKTMRDDRPVPPDGEKLVHHGPVIICESGLHASKRLIDALKYAPGNTICRVDCEDIFKKDDDKFVCRERTILWRIDGEGVIRRFARKCALDVAHLWNMPNIVRRYLETGGESLRAAARAASIDAARAAASAADSAAARAAARAASIDAARAAAIATASDASWAAAWDASWAAAWDADSAAARAAAWDRQNRVLTSMVVAEHKRQVKK